MAFVRESRGDKEPSTSEGIKSNILSYLRFNRKMRAFTEYAHLGGYSDIEDIVAFTSDMKDVWCIEVKCSKQDFLQDFKTKEKWQILQAGAEDESNYAKLFFSKLFFAVPKELEDFVIDYLKDRYPQVGVIVPIGKKWGYARISKSAKAFNPHCIKSEQERNALRESFLDRMSSEIALCYERLVFGG